MCLRASTGVAERAFPNEYLGTTPGYRVKADKERGRKVVPGYHGSAFFRIQVEPGCCRNRHRSPPPFLGRRKKRVPAEPDTPLGSLSDGDEDQDDDDDNPPEVVELLPVDGQAAGANGADGVGGGGTGDSPGCPLLCSQSSSSSSASSAAASMGSLSSADPAGFVSQSTLHYFQNKYALGTVSLPLSSGLV